MIISSPKATGRLDSLFLRAPQVLIPQDLPLVECRHPVTLPIRDGDIDSKVVEYNIMYKTLRSIDLLLLMFIALTKTSL